jgi:hypothetical protein
MQFWGTPASALFYAPLSFFGARTASTLLKLESTVAIFLALWLLWRYFRRFSAVTPAAEWRFAAIFAFASLLFQPFWTVYRVGGQITPTVFLLLVIAMFAYMAGRELITAILLVLVVTMKPAFILIFAGLVLLAGLGFLVRALIVGAVAAGASILILGWQVHWNFLQRIMDGSSVTRIWRYNSSLFVPIADVRHINALGEPSAVVELAASVASAALVAGALATLGYLVWRSRKFEWKPAARRHFNFLIAILLFLLASKVLWEHYLAPLFLLLVYVWANRNDFSRGALVVVAAISAAAATQNLVLVNFIAERVSIETIPAAIGIGLFMAAPLILTLVFLWRYGNEWLRSYVTPEWSRA